MTPAEWRFEKETRYTGEGNPYDLIRAEITIEEKIGDTVMKQLSVGVIPEGRVHYMGFRWNQTNNPTNTDQAAQFFFENDCPAGCKVLMASMPDWPTNLPAMIPPQLKIYYDSLSVMMGDAELPEAAGSIDKCIALLSRPGIDYSPK